MIGNMLKILNIKVFFISLLIGLIFMFFDGTKKNISVFPTPSNIDSVEYKDIAGNCFEYTMENVECPDESKINNIPIQ
jgi:hypothetical protein